MREQGRPLVSIVIPSHNHARFLRDTVESALRQAHRPIEVVVVDDGSTDDTPAVGAAFQGVRFVRQIRQGAAAARNLGFRETAGEYVTFLDADDRLLPEAVALGVEYLAAHPACAFVTGHVRIIDENGAMVAVPPQDHPDASYLSLLRANYVWTPGAVMYRRAALDAYAPFDPAAGGSADYELNIRLARRFDIACHHRVVLDYRRHTSNMSRGAEYMLESAVRVRRRHRKYVRRDPVARAALGAGIRIVQADFGARVVEQVAVDLRAARMRRALRGLLTLARFHPRGLLMLVRRAVSRSGSRRGVKARSDGVARTSRSES